MPIEFKSLLNYARLANREAKYHPHFQENLSHHIVYGIKTVTRINDKDSFAGSLTKPENIPHIIREHHDKFNIENDGSISGFQRYRNKLKQLCKHNEEANNYIIGLQNKLKNVPPSEINEYQKLIFQYSHVQVDIMKKATTHPSHEFIHELHKFIDGIASKDLDKHIQEFFDYVIRK